jgi:FlaA1/EpsC-like NDP-sugar epimerase
MKGLLESLRRFNCSVRTLPSIEDIMANRVTSIDAKKLPLEELIGRRPVAPDMKLMIKNVTGKVVMVTGAGGSVGSELCRQILPLRPTRLVLFDVSEAAMYQIEQSLVQLCEALPSGERSPEIHCIIGNVTRRRDVESAISAGGVEILFHAAAYKHVPMVEKNPQPAIRTNIGGTRITLEAAIRNGVDNFLLISTDKAVRPTNIMGATKRVAEMVVQAKAEEYPDCKTTLSIVRFGNVIGSSGSVVPKFSEQIASGGPVTVTHKDIVRYFMSIPEAAQLVIQASALAEGGDVFLLNMGEPVQIADLAKSLVFLHGKTLRDETNPKGEIEIRYTGLRPGEKLYEELLIDETAVSTTHPKISRARESFLPWQQLKMYLDKFESEMDLNPNGNMKSLLRAVVPGYVPDKGAESSVRHEKEPQSFLRVS